jgi:hypothetical protein
MEESQMILPSSLLLRFKMALPKQNFSLFLL